MTKKLKGLEKKYASESLNMMSEFGITSIQFGSNIISKKGKEVLIQKTSKSKKKRTKP